MAPRRRHPRGAVLGIVRDALLGASPISLRFVAHLERRTTIMFCARAGCQAEIVAGTTPRGNEGTPPSHVASAGRRRLAVGDLGAQQ